MILSTKIEVAFGLVMKNQSLDEFIANTVTFIVDPKKRRYLDDSFKASNYNVYFSVSPELVEELSKDVYQHLQSKNITKKIQQKTLDRLIPFMLFLEIKSLNFLKGGVPSWFSETRIFHLRKIAERQAENFEPIGKITYSDLYPPGMHSVICGTEFASGFVSRCRHLKSLNARLNFYKELKEVLEIMD